MFDFIQMLRSSATVLACARCVAEINFDSSWKLVPFNFGCYWRPQGDSNRAKIASGTVWGGYVPLKMASGRF